MHSQISPVLPGNMFNQVAATAGKEGREQNSGNPTSADSFQAILDEGATPADPNQLQVELSEIAVTTENETGDQPEEIASDDVVDDIPPAAKERESTTPEFGNVANPFEVTDPPENKAASENRANQSQPASADPANRAEKSEPVARPVMAPATPGNTEDVPAATAGSEMAGIKRNGIPAWLVTSPTGENQKHRSNASPAPKGDFPAAPPDTPDPTNASETTTAPKVSEREVVQTPVETRKPGAVVAPDIQDHANRPIDRPDRPAGRDGDAPGLQVKAAVLGRDKSESAGTVATGAAPRAPEKADTPPIPLPAERGRTEAADSLPSFTSRRNIRSEPTSQTLPSPSSVNVPAPNPTAEEAVSEVRNIRWLSEVGFTADVSVQDLPATSRLQQTVLLQQPDLPRNIAVQLAQAFRQEGGTRPMELTLNPAELGRVSISMQSNDGAMTVHVLADRPETLDLMRRHIDILAQEFHDIGFGTADFAFGHNAPEGDGADDGSPGNEQRTALPITDEADSLNATEHRSALKIEADRVDIRL